MTPRFATSEEVLALVRVINAAYRVEDFFVSGDRTTEKDIQARLAVPNARFLVIGDPGQADLAGAVYVEVRGVRGYFGMLAVDPVRQKQGLGRALVVAAEDHCRAAGCRALDIDVVDLRCELPAFYAAFGFIPVGTAPFPHPAKLRRDAHLVLMTKELIPQSK